MTFDIDKTIGDMTSAISDVLAGEWPGISDCVKKALVDEKDALAAISKARLANKIDDEDMNSQLEDEKVALEAAILACRVKAKLAVQNAVNAAIDILKSAIKAAI